MCLSCHTVFASDLCGRLQKAGLYQSLAVLSAPNASVALWLLPRTSGRQPAYVVPDKSLWLKLPNPFKNEVTVSWDKILLAKGKIVCLRI